MEPNEVLGWENFNERWDTRSSQWYAPLDWDCFYCSKMHTSEQSQFFRYLIMLYYSIMNLSGGEQGPRNKIEYLFCYMSLIMSAIVYTNLFGQILNQYQALIFVTIQKQKMKDLMFDVMSVLDLPFDMKTEVDIFWKITENSKMLQDQFDTLLYNLPQSMQISIIRSWLEPALLCNSIVQKTIQSMLSGNEKNQSIFHKINAVNGWRTKLNKANLISEAWSNSASLSSGSILLKVLIHQMGILFTSPEEIIIQQNDFSSSIYFIGSGTCQISQKDTRGEERFFKNLLVKGDHFGEIASLFNTERTCTISSCDYLIVTKLTKPRFRMICSDYPIMFEFLTKHVYQYSDPNKNFIYNVFSKIEYLRDISAELFHQLLYTLEE